tara:strand:- start:566 stop:790 length:225 start_codon:yes stop_codon:yes gene_type:complete
MATRKKSDSGAYMSQYDNEVEVRLKRLEEQVLKLSTQLQEVYDHTLEHEHPSEKVDRLVERFRREWPKLFADFV